MPKDFRTKGNFMEETIDALKYIATNLTISTEQLNKNIIEATKSIIEFSRIEENILRIERIKEYQGIWLW